MSRRLPFLALVALGWYGCQGTLFTIEVERSDEVVVSQGSVLENLLGDLGFDAFLDMDLVAEEELQNQGVEPGDIGEVHLLLFELEALDPPGSDLSFLDSMEIWVEAPDLPSILAAEARSFPEGEPLVEFHVEDVDLADYLVSQSMTVTTVVSGHRPSSETTVEARLVLSVGVTGQGACGGGA